MRGSVNLSQGRQYLAIPGPSVIPDAVLQAMHRPSPNIYAGELIDMTKTIVPDLAAVARTKHSVAMYVGNGHAAWEAALVNTLKEGDKVLVLASGFFGLGWADMARALGIDCQIIDFGKRTPFDADKVAQALAGDAAHTIRAVMVVHVDTSTSVRSDIKALRQVMDDQEHPALLMADCIASLGCDAFEMDAWGVDVTVTACQKGLMTPAGMAFVFFNDKAAQARARLTRVSKYWDWVPRVDPEVFHYYFGGTAPTHHLYGLRAALDLIHGEGIENVWARHRVLARAVWAACEVWNGDGPLELNVTEPEHRSHAVTALRIGAPHGTALREFAETELGLTLGIGLGMAPPGDPAWHGFFRLGHMGHVNGHMIMGLLGGIEAGLEALNIPHGEGALSAAAKVIAGR
jgi:alanine-glyoxylate transaminase/serine-glyoxylate transaminase/serine-pyruvate transaminase